MARWTVEDVKRIDERRKQRKAGVEAYEMQPIGQPESLKKRRGRPPKIQPNQERSGELLALDQNGHIVMDEPQETSGAALDEVADTPPVTPDNQRKWGSVEFMPLAAAPAPAGTYLALAQELLQKLEVSNPHLVAVVDFFDYDDLMQATESVHNFLTSWKGIAAVEVWANQGKLCVRRTEHWA